jgi:hypothetical protein
METKKQIPHHSLVRLELTHWEDYGFCEAMPKGLNGALHTYSIAPKVQVIYSACTACSGMSFFLHPEDPSQNFAVLDNRSKAIARRCRFLEAEFNVLAKGGLLPWLKASTTKESAQEEMVNKAAPQETVLPNCNTCALPDLYVGKNEMITCAIVRIIEEKLWTKREAKSTCQSSSRTVPQETSLE